MNIFVTNQDPHKCALEHCSVHRVKMILEYAQLMSTAHSEWGSWTDAMYKPTHRNHPSAVWTRQSLGNYNYVYEMFRALLLTHKRVTGNDHKSSRLLPVLHRPTCEKPKFSYNMLAMPDEYKQSDICKSYQSYLNDKFKEWRSRSKPLQVSFIKQPSWYIG